MGVTLNPFTGQLQMTGGTSTAANSWKAAVATEATLPTSSNTDGDVRVALDSDYIFCWDATTSRWINQGVKSANAGSTPNAAGYSLGYSNVSTNRRELQLTLQPADATNPGIVSNTTQTIAGNKTFSGSISASNLSGTNAGDVTLAAVGSSPNANGASLSTQQLTLQPASASFPGVVTTGTQTVAGAKTFSGNVSVQGTTTLAAALSGPLRASSGVVATGNTVLTSEVSGILPVANGGTNSSTALNNNRIITSSGSAIVEAAAITANKALASNSSGIPVASATSDTELGFVSGVTSAIQTQINGKQASGNYVTALTGDVTAAGPGSVAATLATVNANVGSFGSATQAGTFTVNAKGLVTAASNTTIAIPFSQVSGTVPLTQGGTNASITAAAGAVTYSTSSALALTAAGSTGQILQSAGTGTPTWSTATYPSTAGTSGTLLSSNGTNIVNTTATYPVTSGTSGTLLTSNGTNIVNTTATYPATAGTSGTILRSNGTNLVNTTATYPTTTTANQLLYSSATNTISEITTAATSALVTNSSSVPSLTSGSTANRLLRTDGTTVSFAQAALATDVSGTLALGNGGTGQTTKAAAFDALSPLTTGGDILYGGASGTGTRLANGTAGYVLTSAGGTTAPAWVNPNAQNYIINADTNIAQRGTSFAAATNGLVTLDRFKYGLAGAAVHTVTQDTDVPTMANANYLFQNSARLNLTTADTSIAAGDFCLFEQRIEGYNWANIAQKAFTLSFWVKATMTSAPNTYCVSFRNSGADRSYVAEYSIAASDTWEYKTITVSASPSAGTWNYTTGIGVRVQFALSCGSTFQTTANAWNTGSFIGTSNQVNGTNTGFTDFRITGIMVNEGSIAAPFSMFGKSADREFIACQRYYQKSFPYATAPATNSGVEDGALTYHAPFTGVTTFGVDRSYPVIMRATPTITYFNPSAANANWRNISAGADSAAAATANSGQNAINVRNAQVVGDVAGQRISVHYTLASEI